MEVENWNAELRTKYPVAVDLTGLSETLPMDHRHLHDYCEISFMLRGKGRYELLEGGFELEEGDIAVFGPGIAHMLKGDSDDALFVPWVLFAGKLVPAECMEAFVADGVPRAYRVHSDAHMAPRLQQCYLRVLEEMQAQDLGYEHAVTALLTEISTLLLRCLAGRCGPEMGAAQPQRFGKALAYIRENWDQELRLADVAAQEHLNPSYFSSLFHRCFGTSLTNYIIGIRMENAVRMLVATDAKVTTVALDCGFGSVTNFYKHFTRMMGTTPGSIRSN